MHGSDDNLQCLLFVMPGLVPSIHVLVSVMSADVDGWDKPGHDEETKGT